MCASPQQYVDVHLPRRNKQALCIGLRYYSVAMCEAYPESAMLDDFRQRKIGRFCIECAFYNVQIWRRLPEEIVSLSIGDVA
jgi:hypothetical protein